MRHAESFENAINDKTPGIQKYPYKKLRDNLIYTKLLDARLTKKGIKQACDLQAMASEFMFPEDTVYCSPQRRAIQTLCYMLAMHPQRPFLNIVLLPLAKEALCSFGAMPVLINDLKREMLEIVIKQFGFKSIDFTLLQDDNLYYIGQL